MNRREFLSFVAALALAQSGRPAPAENDWPQWHGPNRDNISRETGLLKQWPSGGPKLLWTTRGLGDGYGSLAIKADRIYVQGTSSGQSAVFALDRATGKPVWHAPIGRALDQDRGGGPRGTPTVDGDVLYVFEINSGLPVLGSFGGIVWGHVRLVIPWTVRLITASLAGFDRTLEEAAQNLGASRFTTFRRITMPVILPGIVAGAMFGFVSSFGNLEMSLFLVGPGRTTLPIAILQYLQWKIDPTIASISVLQILLIAIAMLVTDRFVNISRVV